MGDLAPDNVHKIYIMFNDCLLRNARNEFFSRCRASPLTLSLSRKGRGDSVGLPCVGRQLPFVPWTFESA
jgi:hypothetical protein